MIELDSYLLFVAATMVLVLAPGPDMAYGDEARKTGRTIFWQGFWSDVLNPKVALFFLAFLPQFVDAGSPNQTLQLLMLGLTCNVIGITINLILVYCASAVTGKLRESRRVSTWLNRSMGVIFVALGVRLAGEKL